ncbi:potassium channel family protein [Dermatobacter hominis]|uniref:potassium channel family protein n=1 Tax=Dermatobacter hominis TaxID=2884263 RepID=UPI001D12FC8F|nr:potassium channel family protein [Dermatobacter hominis]UDY36004.1 potassium channel family protein [Dermatobacter hominis]
MDPLAAVDLAAEAADVAMAGASLVLALLGLWLVVAVLLSAIRTVVVPRGERPVLTSIVFLTVRRVMDPWLRRCTPARRERLLRRYAPLSLVALAGSWGLLVIVGFTPVHWAMGELNWIDAIQVSGSSLTTLGFISAEPTPARLVEVVEAFIGLGLVGLLISFLPAIYAAYSQREQLVAQMASRAGEPPSVGTFLARMQRIRGLIKLDDTWEAWEGWFAAIEETHTSYPALVYFRSGDDRSWLTAAGCLLDSGSVYLAAVDVPRSSAAALCLRSGFLCLREVADQFLIPYDPDPAPDDPISITRAEFDACWDELAEAGLPMVADRDQAWRDFAGWRVNYDTVLLSLCALVEPPPAPWSSDRVHPVPRHPIRQARALRRAARST